jgi:hypothetical protein
MAGLNESPIEEPHIFMLPGGRMDTKNAAIYLGRSVAGRVVSTSQARER